MIRGPSITRRDFISKFMKDCGLNYDQACRVYSCMVSVVADAVVSQTKIGIGQVGAIFPIKRPPRAITMGFRRMKGGEIERTRRTYHLDERISWQFKLFEEFEKKHNLRER